MRGRGKPESKAVRVILGLADAEAAGASIDRSAADLADSIGRVVNAECLVSGGGGRDVDGHSSFVMKTQFDAASTAIRPIPYIGQRRDAFPDV